MIGASYRRCPAYNLYKSYRDGWRDLMASSTWSQKELKSAGSGKRSFVSGVIWDRIYFLSFPGRYVASDAKSQTSDCGMVGTGGRGAYWTDYALLASA